MVIPDENRTRLFRHLPSAQEDGFHIEEALSVQVEEYDYYMIFLSFR